MLVISLPEGVVRLARTEGLADGGPDALAMHLALGEPRYRRPRGHRVFVVDIEASPEAWEAFVAWAYAACRLPAGKVSNGDGRERKLLNAARKVERQLTRLAGHPAYRGLGVAATVTTVLPARRVEGDERWWPTARMALRAGIQIGSNVLEFGEMVPDNRKVRGRAVTTWTFQPASDRAAPARSRPH